MENTPFPLKNPETLQTSLINIALEAWRFGKVFERALAKLDATEQSRYLNQYRWFTKKITESLTQSGLRLVDIEGHLFEPGMAVTPLNIEEFNQQDLLMIEQMVEPIIMNENTLIKSGTVILCKAPS